MLTHRNFSACIVADGKVLPEYLTLIDADANRVECWIPNQPGKTFSVHWMDHGTHAYSCGFIYLDGVVHPGRFLNGRGQTSRQGVRTGPALERPFVFPNTNASTFSLDSDEGTIMLKIRLVGIQGVKSANPIQQPRKPVNVQGDKGISYGNEQTTYRQYPSTWNVVPHDGTGNRSYVTFVFRCMPPEFISFLQSTMTEEVLR